MLLLGRDDDDPLFLQVKEAQAVGARAVPRPSEYANHGQRVVEGQRLMQAASDIFLGWIRTPRALDGDERDFYVRQLWDWKGSVDRRRDRLPDGARGSTAALRLDARARPCALGRPVAIAAYLGSSDAFDRAIADSRRPTPTRTSATTTLSCRQGCRDLRSRIVVTPAG